MKVILLIDIQESYMNNELKELPSNIETYLKQEHYDIVIATRFINKNDGLHHNNCYIKQMTVFNPKAKLVDTIEKIADFVLMKSTYTSYTQDVQKLISKNEIKEVYLAGVNTETNILSTAFDLFDKGIKPIVISNLCGSVNGERIHHQALEILKLSMGEDCIV